MKIAISGDCHLNRSTYQGVRDNVFTSLPFRSVDFMNAFEHIVEKIITEIKPDMFVVPGDVFDSYDPSNDVRSFLSRQMKKLLDNNIPTIILVGNHDVCQKNHALQTWQSLGIKGIKIIDEPSIMKFKDYVFLLFPHSLTMEQKKITIVEQFNKFIESAKEKIKDIDKDKILFFGHFGVSGGKMSGGVENKRLDSISVADLDNIGASHVFLGDYHHHQFLSTKKCYSLYTGSIERTDMDEANDDKGFVVYDSSVNEMDGYGKSHFIVYPNVRPMIEIQGNLNEINRAIDMIGEEYKNAIVKIVFSGKREELDSFEICRNELQKRIFNKIDPIHIRMSSNVVDENENLIATQMEKEIIDKGHVSSTDVLPIVFEILEEREKDEQELIILKNNAEEIYKQAMEKR